MNKLLYRICSIFIFCLYCQRICDTTSFLLWLQGSYVLRPSVLYIDDSMVPSFLANGKYRVDAVVTKGSKNVACLHLEFTVVWLVNSFLC